MQRLKDTNVTTSLVSITKANQKQNVVDLTNVPLGGQDIDIDALLNELYAACGDNHLVDDAPVNPSTPPVLENVFDWPPISPLDLGLAGVASVVSGVDGEDQAMSYSDISMDEVFQSDTEDETTVPPVCVCVRGV
jgi:hypothetical protein